MYVSNPYLTMAHVAAVAAGWTVIGVRELENLDAAANRGDLVHIHWTAPVLKTATDRADATKRVDAFISTLDALKSGGARILWTVHNEIAHDSPWPESEIVIAEALASRADTIIQMHDHTAEAVSVSYNLPPSKLVTLPHSSYLGVYGAKRDPIEARNSLGIETGERVVGFVGQVRRYKGIGTLCEAVDIAAQADSELTLVIAGASGHAGAMWLKDSMPKHTRVVHYDRRVPDRTLADWVCAADVIALPYERVLNSGTLLLAATYGRPVIVPSNTALASVYKGESWVHVYDADIDGPKSLARAITSALSTAREDSAMAYRFAKSWTPYDMSRSYLGILEAVANA